MGMITIILVVFIFGIGVTAGYYYTRHRYDEDKKTAPPPQPVRDAGPEHMDNPPPRWNAVDQQADESFPASDPPGNY